MTIRKIYVALVYIIILGISACNQHEKPPADTVIVNAKIYTVNPDKPWAEALAIGADKVIAVGSDKDITDFKGLSTKIIDAKGHMVLPGLIESHVHMMAGASILEQVTLNDAKTIEDFQKLIKEYAGTHPEKKWIRRMGWFYSIFGKDGLPDNTVFHIPA